MPESMNISVNGHSQVPPGFRFHPTEEELLNYYLRKKVSFEKIDLDVIRDVDLNKLEPWDIQEKCKIGTTPQNDWYFFSNKDKKYPTGTRTNRATAVGFWKATGRDKMIYTNCNRIGLRKTLVFYKGRAPHGQKSDWIMHEYRLDDNTLTTTAITGPSNVSNVMGEGAQEEGWVVCRVFKKKNHERSIDKYPSVMNISDMRLSQNMSSPSKEGALEQILQYTEWGSTCKEENDATKNIHTRFAKPIGIKATASFQDMIGFMKLPELESPHSPTSQRCYQIAPYINNQVMCTGASHETNSVYSNNCNYISSSAVPSTAGLTSWAALDRLVASQLNGQSESSSGQIFNIDDPTITFCATTDNNYDLQLPTLQSSSSSFSSRNNEMDLMWNFTRPPSS